MKVSGRPPNPIQRLVKGYWMDPSVHQLIRDLSARWEVPMGDVIERLVLAAALEEGLLDD